MPRLLASVRAHARSLAELAGLGAALTLTDQPAGAAPVDVAAATLVGASASTALFTATAMVPGAPHSRCLDVALPGTGDVLLRATGVSGALAPYLQVRVEVGQPTGAPPGSCAGFTGAEVFTGTLAELAQRSTVDPYGVGTSWTLTPAAPSRAFRITVEVADRQAAQGLAARADLVWALVGGSTPSPTPTPTPTTTPTPATPAPSGEPSPAPVEPSPVPTIEPTDRPGWEEPWSEPTAVPTPAPTTAPPAGEPDDPDQSDTGLGQLLRMLGAVPVEVTQTMIGTVRQSGFPAALFGLIGLFLLIQDTVDRRDPKLALAPMDDDDGLPFEPVVDR